jgi:hypothetical protein
LHAARPENVSPRSDARAGSRVDTDSGGTRARCDHDVIAVAPDVVEGMPSSERDQGIEFVNRDATEAVALEVDEDARRVRIDGEDPPLELLRTASQVLERGAPTFGRRRVPEGPGGAARSWGAPGAEPRRSVPRIVHGRILTDPIDRPVRTARDLRDIGQAVEGGNASRCGDGRSRKSRPGTFSSRASGTHCGQE